MRPLDVRPATLSGVEPADWDALAARTPWATPFSRWAIHRAWWDGYGSTAEEVTLLLTDPAAGGRPVAIVPLMRRHEVEPTDREAHTALRTDSDEELTAVRPSAQALFFGASYHADYATILADPADLPSVAEALAAQLAGGGEQPWDALDLRRFRTGDPAMDALAAALLRREASAGWTVNVEREDVCPVATLPEGVDFEGYLDTLGKKERHEIRRKVRRAEAVGEVRLARSADPLADLPAFIDLHQRRWGADGLFPDTPGGARSRRFFERLVELVGVDGPLSLSFLTVGDRRIAAGVHLDDGTRHYYYNAGVDPDARELSPGVVMVAKFVELAIAQGRRSFDFLRGDEPYKYEWGAVDEPIHRLLVRRGTQGER